MVVPQEAVFQNRRHAAFLLGERLMEYRNTDNVVVAVPGGGIHMGAYLSELLNLPLDVMPCRKIKHPADPQKTIGAVSVDAVVLPEQDRNLPQDYVYHQIQLLQHVIDMQARHYAAARPAVSFEGKTIIVVDDLMLTGDSVLACVKAVKQHNPAKVVVAVPNVTPAATQLISGSIDGIVYLTIEPNAAQHLYAEFPPITEQEVIDILRQRAAAMESVTIL
ncbi:phosphoribosyltransferase family protein [Chryseolinea sp. T2]|uniref:phosphoribosyltransferase n=1 Tax=Chryseolinea sp. T2 TaxID=3129255 RepID=UPI003078897C